MGLEKFEPLGHHLAPCVSLDVQGSAGFDSGNIDIKAYCIDEVIAHRHDVKGALPMQSWHLSPLQRA